MSIAKNVKMLDGYLELLTEKTIGVSRVLVLLVAVCCLMVSGCNSLLPTCSRCNGTGYVGQEWLDAHGIHRWSPGSCSVCGGSGHASASDQREGETGAMAQAQLERKAYEENEQRYARELLRISDQAMEGLIRGMKTGKWDLSR